MSDTDRMSLVKRWQEMIKDNRENAQRQTKMQPGLVSQFCHLQLCGLSEPISSSIKWGNNNVRLIELYEGHLR